MISRNSQASDANRVSGWMPAWSAALTSDARRSPRSFSKQVGLRKSSHRAARSRSDGETSTSFTDGRNSSSFCTAEVASGLFWLMKMDVGARLGSAQAIAPGMQRGMLLLSMYIGLASNSCSPMAAIEASWKLLTRCHGMMGLLESPKRYSTCGWDSRCSAAVLLKSASEEPSFGSCTRTRRKEQLFAMVTSRMQLGELRYLVLASMTRNA
mmetsp:Transcript_48749/g.127393  ORF Transcript_48749/g.127393 Transcript_48749/m.127393 type:complete len:211 (+) Transcript_48749:339-971(+)